MKYMSIAYSIICLVLVIVTFNFFTWHRQQVVEFEQSQIDLQVNYCIDAAMQEILETTADIETDYTDYRYMEVNPITAFSVYVDMLLRNVGWSDTLENREALITDYIPFFVVCGYDGYYLCSKQPVNYDQKIMLGSSEMITKNTVYDLVWTPKIPYAKAVWNPVVEDYDYEAYNLACANFDKFCKNSKDGKYVLYEDLEMNEDTLYRAKATISQCVSDACTSALTSSLEGKSSHTFYIPAEMGAWIKASTIEAPTLITYVDKIGVKNTYGAQVFAVGGAAVSESIKYIAYKKGFGDEEIKCYTSSLNRDAVEGLGYTIDEIYTSKEDAAKDGYWFDVDFMH